jgi:hypothetical protein
MKRPYAAHVHPYVHAGEREKSDFLLGQEVDAVAGAVAEAGERDLISEWEVDRRSLSDKQNRSEAFSSLR